MTDTQRMMVEAKEERRKVLLELEKKKFESLNIRLAITNAYDSGLLSKEDVLNLITPDPSKPEVVTDNDLKNYVSSTHQNNLLQPQLSYKTLNDIYALYKSDKEKWTLNRLSIAFRLPRSRIASILVSKHYEDVHKEQTVYITKDELLVDLNLPKKTAEAEGQASENAETNTNEVKVTKEENKSAIVEEEKVKEEVLEEEEEGYEGYEGYGEYEEYEEEEEEGNGLLAESEQMDMDSEIPLIKDTQYVDLEALLDRTIGSIEIEPNLNDTTVKTYAKPFASTWRYEEDEFDEHKYATIAYNNFVANATKRFVPEKIPPHLIHLKDSKILRQSPFDEQRLTEIKRKTPIGGGKTIVVNHQTGRTNKERELYIKDADGVIRTANWEERRIILNRKPQRNIIKQAILELYTNPEDRPKSRFTTQEIKAITFR